MDSTFLELRNTVTRNEAITRIRAGLKSRSGKDWSVTGGRGTAWGWITITSPPRRRQPESSIMTEEDRAELGQLLGLSRPVHCQGESVPSSHDHWVEYIDRAEGRPPRVTGKQYWD